jgi:chaperone modulatory protein CbpM
MSAPAVPSAALLVRDPQPANGAAMNALAHETGLHPELVRRLVALGFVELRSGVAPVDAAATIARAMRLRHDLGLNYAGALLASELLDRIDRLDRRLQRYESAARQRR